MAAIQTGRGVPYMRQIIVEGQTLDVKDGTTYLELAKNFQKKFDHDIVLVLENNKMRELFRKVKDGATVTFLTTGQIDGYNTYRRSATLLLLKAIYDVEGMEAVRGMKVEFSVSEGYYVSSKKMPVDQETLGRIGMRMKELVNENLPIEKHSIPVEEAIEHFTEHGMIDKARLFRFRRSSSVNVYLLDNFEDYYYGYMVPSTGYLKYFKLIPYDEGFVLEFPPRKTPETFGPFKEQHKVFQTLKSSTKWGEILDVGTVGALNEQISAGNIGNIILAQEAIMEKGLGDIAAEIASRPDKKLIMIAGPSSSGKTTFSHRLSIQLEIAGLTPHPVSMDDYFLDRELSPRDENGNYNFETIASLDVDLLTKHINQLLDGEEIDVPSYNFISGKREYRGHKLKIGEKDVLVMEGIHGLNGTLTNEIPEDAKYRIYVSALNQINLDEHNRIPSSDGRLLRRIVRDAMTRGNDARETISRWDSVRTGEEDNIFPYQEEADVMFNSAQIYEIAVLKQYAEPLLFAVPRDCPEYQEAKRLLKFLEYFLNIPSEAIPKTSLLREFIGGSCFEV